MTVEGLRARKKLDTRRRIESAALGLFESDGFEQTTVGDIAAAADIAPRTFFHYFETKEDVILSDYTDRLKRIVSVLTERPPEEHAWQALQQAFLVVAADYESEKAQLLRRFRIMATTPSVFARSLQLQAGWEDALAEALAGRLVVDRSTDVTPRLMASTASGGDEGVTCSLARRWGSELAARPGCPMLRTPVPRPRRRGPRQGVVARRLPRWDLVLWGFGRRRCTLAGWMIQELLNS